jgi:hypothetical protein
MRHAFLAVLVFGVMFSPALAADHYDADLHDADHHDADHRGSGPVPSVGAKTGKERLSDKGSDEQRVDDCKVPRTQRTRARPTACPWDVRS